MEIIREGGNGKKWWIVTSANGAMTWNLQIWGMMTLYWWNVKSEVSCRIPEWILECEAAHRCLGPVRGRLGSHSPDWFLGVHLRGGVYLFAFPLVFGCWFLFWKTYHSCFHCSYFNNPILKCISFHNNKLIPYHHNFLDQASFMLAITMQSLYTRVFQFDTFSKSILAEPPT